MRKVLSTLIISIGLVLVAGCNNTDKDVTDDTDELLMLEVEFDVPEAADVDENIELKATVTYGHNVVDDADEVNFEYWEGENKDNSVTLDSKNDGDGVYTADVTFAQDGTYTIYAHTTARDLHTMPKKIIKVGTGEGHATNEDTDTEGFDMHFMNPENAKSNEESELMVHLQLDQNPFEHANVRYEVWNDEISDKHEWIDAIETTAGEYVGTYSFEEVGTYTVQIHVEDNDGLHEHEEYDVQVTE